MLLTEYNDLVKNYKEQKQSQAQKYQKSSEHVILEKDETEVVPSSRQELTTTQNSSELVEDFVDCLKISRLKAVEEKNFLNKFHRIVAIYNHSLKNLEEKLEDSKRHTKSYEKLIKRYENEVVECKEERIRKESIIEQLKSDLGQVKFDLKCMEQTQADERKVFQNERNMLKDQTTQDMHSFLSKIEREVEQVRSVMKEEMHKRIEEAKCKLEKEQNEDINHLNEVISQLKIEIKYLTKTNSSMSQEHENYIKKIEELKNMNGCLQEEINAAQESIKERDEHICGLEQAAVKERELWHKKLESQLHYRDMELQNIEGKVKQIVQSKDEKMRSFMTEAKEQEAKVKKLEKFIMRIESGLPEMNL